MKAIINVNEIRTALNGQEINEETIAQAIISNCYETIFNDSSEGNAEVDQFFAGIYENKEIYIHSNFIQSFKIDGEDGEEFEVRINENFVDSGSVDYCYSFTVYSC